MLDFTQIQHYNRHGKRKTYGLRQFRFHFSKVAFAFCKAELSFNLYPFILVEMGLPPIALLVPSRSSQCRTAEPDSVQFAVAEVFAVSVNLVRQHALRIMSLRRLTKDTCRRSLPPASSPASVPRAFCPTMRPRLTARCSREALISSWKTARMPRSWTAMILKIRIQPGSFTINALTRC